MPTFDTCIFAKEYFIKALLFIFIIFTASCALKPDITMNIEDHLQVEKSNGTVVLLHGLWRDSTAMNPMQVYLIKAGYKVKNISYPSDKYPIEQLVQEHLLPVINAIAKSNPREKVHFVTHSMGGILVRYYLKNNTLPNLGNVVMLSPPNQGSELSDIATSMSLDWPGPAGEQLSTSKNSWVKSLGPVDFTLGVIAGNYNSNWITAWLLNGQDDGVVSVNDTKVSGMTDFIIVPEKHFRIRKLPLAMQQTVYFLQNGLFHKKPV